jgi:hypothetical protein
MREDGIPWSTQLESIVLPFVYAKNVVHSFTLVPNTISRKLAISLLWRSPEPLVQDFSQSAKTRLSSLFTPESDFVSKHCIPANVMTFATSTFLRYHWACGGRGSRFVYLFRR